MIDYWQDKLAILLTGRTIMKSSDALFRFALGYRSLSSQDKWDSLKDRIGTAAIWLFIGILIGMALK